MFAPICYFVVCFTLQQCNQFAAEFAVHQPGSSLDIFFWEQGAERRLSSSSHSLDRLIEGYPELSHWAKLRPAAAMHWLPYYHYYNSQHDSEQCQFYVKYTADVRFTGRDPEETLYPQLKQAQRDNVDAVISLEAKCSPGHQMTAFNAVINLHDVMQMLTYYQLESQRQPLPIYPENHLDNWLQQNPEHLRSAGLDLTVCTDESTAGSVENLPFYKVLLKSPAVAFAEEEARLAAAEGCSLSVF